MHGVITHGEQFRAPEWRNLATSYYGESSGIGRAITGLRGDKNSAPTPQKIGLIGLGVGTIATYGRAGDTYRIYELNPEVLNIANKRFTYLSDSASKIETALGDARLVLAKEVDQQFNVIAIDAFSSDSIPVHLITREAMAIYKRHLKPHGVIAIHISNRYLDLTGVTKQLANEQGMHALLVTDDPGEDSYLYRSDWVLITSNSQIFHNLRDSGLGKEFGANVRLRPWTDNFNNLFEVLK
jgi:spermidine synthase